MISYISGEASRGALLRGAEYYGFVLDSTESLKLREGELANFFMHARDVHVRECSSDTHLMSEIESAWKKDRTLRLSLMAFDETWDSDTRTNAAQYVEHFIGEELCHDFLVYSLYAQPLPSGLDINEIADLLSSHELEKFENLFEVLISDQESIRNCVTAWDELPKEMFDNEYECNEFRVRIIQTGAFYKFATSTKGNNDALFRILADPGLALKSAKTRQVVERWASHYREMPEARAVYDDPVVDAEREQRSSQALSNFEVFQRVRKQKVQIKHEISSGNFSRAERLVEEPITDQRAKSSREHLAKSLCDLAIYSKQLGDVERYFAFSLRATEEAPHDGWAAVQLGNAYIAKSDFSQAMVSFENAEKLGEERSALLGRAEVLKYLGQKDSAIQVLEECSQRFPQDDVAKNSLASLLAHFGLLDDALAAYNKLANSPFASSHVYGGRGAVMADLGRFEDAVRDYDIAITLADPADAVVPRCARADALREQGLFSEAMKSVDPSLDDKLTRLQLKSARARIYRDAGDLDKSDEVLRSIATEFPNDSNCRVALAEIYRKRGMFDEALEVFLKVENDFPYAKYARNSMAATLASLDRSDDALTYLSSRQSATRSDWVGQHIRAMIEMKRGSFPLAEALLNEGLHSCPWRAQHAYFASALASLRLRRREPERALRLLDSVERPCNPAAVEMLAVLRIHALAAMGNASQEMFTSLKRSSRSPLVASYLSDLEASFLRAANDGVFAPDEALFDREWSMLVSLAA